MGPGPIFVWAIQHKSSSEMDGAGDATYSNYSPAKVDSFRLEFQKLLPQLGKGTINGGVGAFDHNIKISHSANWAEMSNNICSVAIEKSDESSLLDFLGSWGISQDNAPHKIMSGCHSLKDDAAVPSFG